MVVGGVLFTSSSPGHLRSTVSGQYYKPLGWLALKGHSRAVCLGLAAKATSLHVLIGRQIPNGWELVWTSPVHAHYGGPNTDWLYTSPGIHSGLKKNSPLSSVPFPRYQEHLLSRGVWAEVASCLQGGRPTGQPPSLVAHGQALQGPAVRLLHTAVSRSSSTLRNRIL